MAGSVRITSFPIIMIVRDEYGWKWEVKPVDPASGIIKQLTKQGFTDIVIPRQALFNGVVDMSLEQIDEALLTLVEEDAGMLYTMRDCCEAVAEVV